MLEYECMLLPLHRVKKRKPLRWNYPALLKFITNSVNLMRNKKKFVSHRSSWWSFIFSWDKNEEHEKKLLVHRFMQGNYTFQPLESFSTPAENLIVWSYADRVFVRALLFIIKPLFKHIISPRCTHLKGPSGVKFALNLTNKALATGKFRYFMRIDIKSFYASINRKILFQLAQRHFKDPRVINYLEQIIYIPITQHGAVLNPTLGIHRRSSMSPFFGALYLSPLDQLFEQAKSIYYVRYMDDLLILTKTKRQYCKAKRHLQQTLFNLQLKISKNKSKMGPLNRGFHFLGINFSVNPLPVINQELAQAANVKVAAPQSHATQSHVSIALHNRSCARALDRVALMEEDLANSRDVQRYLVRRAVVVSGLYTTFA